MGARVFAGSDAVNELERVRDAARRLEGCRAAYRAAILAARESGASLAAIGAAAGVSKQSVDQLIRRQSAGSESEVLKP